MPAAHDANPFAYVKGLFPIFSTPAHQELIYFDNGATTHKPEAVINALSSFYREQYGTVHRAIYRLAEQATEQYEEVRQQVATFLNAQSAEEIVFTRGTTNGINLVARTLGEALLSPGDQVIVSELEHHSNLVPWQLCCQRHDATLRVIRADDAGCLDLDHFASLLSSKTKVVALAHISNALGTQHPIEKIARMAHQVGALLLVDGAQAAAHQPIDVQKPNADFYLFSGHKCYGPTGVGVLYAKKQLLELLPPYESGGEMVEQVTLQRTTYQPPPLKFEAGTPMVAEVIGLGAALTFLQSLDLHKLFSWEQKLLSYATERLQERPQIHIIGTAPDKGAILSFVVDGIHPLDLGSLLDLSNIAVRTGNHCAQPAMQRYGISGTTRLSFGCYNSMEEIDRFLEKLDLALHRLKRSSP